MGKTIPNLPNSDLHKHTSCTLGNYKDKRKRSWRTRGGLSVSSASGQVACLSHEQVEQPNRQKKKKKEECIRRTDGTELSKGTQLLTIQSHKGELKA